ncbi:MAG: hypothetical protein U1F29_16845 [Planctomycetota bacterium]
MADSAHGPESFDAAWGPFGRVVAVVSAALVALVGVIAHVPVWLASLRGFATLCAVLALLRVAAFVAGALPRSETNASAKPASSRKERA